MPPGQPLLEMDGNQMKNTVVGGEDNEVDYYSSNRSSAADQRGSSNDTQSPAQRRQSLLQDLLGLVNPTSCLTGQCLSSADEEYIDSGSCQVPFFDEEDVKEIAKALVPEIKKGGKARTVALQKLYRLTDKNQKINRVPLVCTTKVNIVDALCLCLDVSSKDRRLALLLLNNLCIPIENKAAIVLSPDTGPKLITLLLGIIQKRLQESYLAIVCLFTLSFLRDAKTLMFFYVPKQDTRFGQKSYRSYAPTDNPLSLLRTIESAMKTALPYWEKQVEGQDKSQNMISKRATAKSVEQEIVRWGMALMRSLVLLKDSAIVCATETEIPQLALLCLQVSNRDLCLWTRDSLEDSSLGLLIHLAQYDECLLSLQKKLLVDQENHVLRSLHGKGGIHETRGVVLLKRLQDGVTEEDMKQEDKQVNQSTSFGVDEKKDC